MGWVEGRCKGSSSRRYLSFAGEGQDIMYEVIKSTGADCVLNLLSHDPNIVNLQVPVDFVIRVNLFPFSGATKHGQCD